jgi:hypothetical protein
MIDWKTRGGRAHEQHFETDDEHADAEAATREVKAERSQLLLQT